MSALAAAFGRLASAPPVTVAVSRSSAANGRKAKKSTSKAAKKSERAQDKRPAVVQRKERQKRSKEGGARVTESSSRKRKATAEEDDDAASESSSSAVDSDSGAETSESGDETSGSDDDESVSASGSDSGSDSEMPDAAASDASAKNGGGGAKKVGKVQAKDVVLRSTMSEKDKLALDQRTVFLGNLPVALGTRGLQRSIRALFRTGGAAQDAGGDASVDGQPASSPDYPFGNIESLRFRGAAIDKTMPARAAYATNTFQTTRDSLLAYVVLKSPEDARRAADALNGALVGSHHIRADVAAFQNHRSFDARRSVFVGNVPFHASEEALRKHFAAALDGDNQTSTIVNVRVVRDKETQLGSGIAYIVFSDANAVERAIKNLHGTKIDPALLPAVPQDNEDLAKAASRPRPLRVMKCTKKESAKSRAQGASRGSEREHNSSERGRVGERTRGTEGGARGRSASVNGGHALGHQRWRDRDNESSERPTKFLRGQTTRGGAGRGRAASFMGQKSALGHDSMRNIKETRQHHDQRKAARGGGSRGGGRGRRGRGGSRGGHRGGRD